MKWPRLLISWALLPLANSAIAADVFTVTVTTEGQSGTVTSNTVDEFIDAARNLGRAVPAYTQASVATANLSFRGLPMIISYPNASTRLVFSVPSTGLVREFQGATRRESERQLEAYLRANTDNVLTDIFKTSVATTAIDPVAGNPNSLMGVMTASDFQVGTQLGPEGGSGPSPGGLEPGATPPNLIGLAARFGSYSAGNFHTNVATLPFEYTINLADPRWGVILQAPFTYVDTEGSLSYAGSLGVGLRAPVTDNWSLTPTVRFGAVGSADLGAVALIVSGALSSNYNMYFDQYKATIGNMFGIYHTISVDAGAYHVDYDLTNFVFRNGVGLEGPLGFEVFGQPTSWQASAVYTAFTGDALYISHYVDLALSLGTRVEAGGVTWDAVRLGVTVTVGEHDFKGVRANLGYRF